MFIDQHSVDLFFFDQWSYLTTSLFQSSLAEGFLTPLGPHRIGLAYPFFKSALVISDFNNRAIGFLVGSFAILNAFLFTQIIIKRFGKIGVEHSYIPLIFFTLNQYAILLNNPNIAIHQLIFTLMLLLVMSVHSGVSGWKYYLILGLIPLVTFTGNGFFLILVFIGFSVLMIVMKIGSSRRWLTITAIGTIAIIAYLNTANYQAMDCAGITLESPLYYFRFIRGLTLNGMVISYSVSYLKDFLFIVLIIAASIKLKNTISKADSISQLSPLLIIGYSVLFFAATTIGRWCYGPEITDSSRYVPHAAFLFLGFGLLIKPAKQQTQLLYGIALSAVFMYAEYKFYKWRLPAVINNSESMMSWKKCYIREGSAKFCNENQKFQPYPGDIGPIKLEEKLQRLKELNPSFVESKKPPSMP